MGDTKPDEAEDAIENEDDAVNAVGAAAQTADPSVGRPVSGMPLGGPHDLGKEAHDRAREERRKA
ncbi:hypothetical protein NX02_11180 [Sphingomonas sanxanigenens DSM 19645 = NX02]|uniref:Uncharacterized protein n=2 Tax=Sphingomonas sanxanigenens TaxID=397260 RepID=W0ACB1_9SPHN|nr:hypothetical protein NX02_11180 [Sphingomonas sanxanigenens DSM 19645 = NX02]